MPQTPLGNINLSQFLDMHTRPPRIWIGPSPWVTLRHALATLLGPEAELIPVPPPAGQPLPEGPAVVLLSVHDMVGIHRETLLELVKRAEPGRPVIHGGDDKDVLLDAINTWRAFRLVPSTLPPEAVADAVTKAHDALTMEQALDRCADELRSDCRHLTSAVAELEATQQRLLHRERLAAIGQMTGLLMERVQKHFGSMDEFATSLKPLAERPGVGPILRNALDGTRSVNVLLKDLIALAENRSEEVCADDQQLDHIVERTVALFQLDPIAQHHEFNVSCHSEATVRVDRYRIFHVLMNLLRNAVQATEADHPIAVRTLINDHEAVIEIEDHGHGMSPEVLDQIFTPFFTTKGQSGTGLGLRMSKSAVERHGGGLECVSTPGDGTCFRVRLPMVTVGPVHDPEADDATEKRPTGS